ncbi:sensor domain-containing diguanylate cyclase [Clostridium estertheticum]|uniref:Sensor domain-containing diguanylate cyclase n=1 Tax=Clostridium estertheticum TaxID=238834 RepID=A0A7Y3WUJ2_9CLOT|nr:sensor domain-containing diguanylate cyclase [Clostridium estertheticum]NNU78179.1 sensor domain-containing diguanylate cyclase [Clostridium estertheticum]WBL47709.1 sensor domain-containing diguanylate cyclase [Clostridium estertheticum]
MINIRALFLGFISLIVIYFIYRRTIKCGVEVKFYKRVLHYTKDIIYYYQAYPEVKFLYVSPSVREMLGRHENDFYNDSKLVFNTVHKDDYEDLYNKTIGQVDFSKPQFTRWLHSNGEYVFTEDHAVPIYDKAGRLIAVEGSIRDITYRKKLEDELEHRSTHDKMTGLYNREYYEQYFNDLDKKNEATVGIIVCDLDGLKHTNDNFGHKVGDKLIIEATKIINSHSLKNIIVSRIGGDEISIITIGLNEKMIEDMISCIKGEIIEFNELSVDIFIRISIGFAITHNSLGNMTNLFKTADENMYKVKRTAIR